MGSMEPLITLFQKVMEKTEGTEDDLDTYSKEHRDWCQEGGTSHEVRKKINYVCTREF